MKKAITMWIESNLDREAMLVADLDGGVLKRNKEAKFASGFWKLLSNVFHLTILLVIVIATIIIMIKMMMTTMMINIMMTMMI